MERAEYVKLQTYESWYWWYAAQRRGLIEIVRGLRLRPQARVLDAGCSTGRNLVELARELGVRGFGIDLSRDAAAFWKGEENNLRCVASFNELPYIDESFDAVISVDVLGCAGVVAEQALQEATRVLRNSGVMILLVPAYQWMISAHDRAVHSVRRFVHADVREMLGKCGLHVEYITYRFAILFPFIAAIRLCRKWVDREHRVPRSDLSPMPGWLNRGLLAAALAEQRLFRKYRLPFGSTILAVARKGVG